jgi:hypothetical protein
VLLIGGLGFFLYQQFGGGDSPKKSKQKTYDQAQELMEDGEYLEAMEKFQSIGDYKDSAEQLQTIYAKYNGYYQSEDLNIVFYINIQSEDTVELMLRRLVGGKDLIWLEDYAALEDGEIELPFTDSSSKSGTLTVTLKNDKILIHTVMDNLNEPTIGNLDLEYTLDQRMDAPKSRKITGATILSWMTEQTTLADLNRQGYVPEFVEEVPFGDGTLDYAHIYKLPNSNVRFLAMQIDLPNTPEQPTSETLLDDFIIYAVIAPAELVTPQDIGTAGRLYQSGGILYYPGAETMLVQQSKVSKNSVYFNLYQYKLETNLIQNTTMIGMTSQALLGDANYTEICANALNTVAQINFAYTENILGTGGTAASTKFEIKARNGDKVLAAVYVEGGQKVAYYELNYSTLEVKLMKKIICSYANYQVADDEWYKYPEIFSSFSGHTSWNEYGGRYMYVTANGALHLRAYPSADSELIAAMPTGREVYVYSISGEWAFVDFEGLTGYCAVQYLANEMPYGYYTGGGIGGM